MKKSKTYVLVLVLAAIFFLAGGELSAQCAMCKQAAESSLKSNPNSMARSLNTGILYLMAVPYLLLLFIFRKQLVHLWKSKFGKISKTEESR